MVGPAYTQNKNKAYDENLPFTGMNYFQRPYN